VARLRLSISENDAAHKQAVDAMHSQHASNVQALRKQLKEVFDISCGKRRHLID
jgi:hypothetical protein